MTQEQKKQAKHGMKLHKFIATGGKPSEFKGMVGKIENAKNDAEIVGSELKEKTPK